jgi:hypothetical protein
MPLWGCQNGRGGEVCLKLLESVLGFLCPLELARLL